MSFEPVRSASSLYFERYARAEHQGMAMGLVACLSGALCFVLVAALLVMALRPRPIHYVPSASAGGVSYPEDVPAASAVSFASFWLMNWANYAPDTARDVYARALVLAAPSMAARVRSGLEAELQKIDRERISSVFMPAQEPKVEEGVRGFAVTFCGQWAVYIGKEEMSREDVRFVVEVRRAPVTAKNPYGLVVWDVKKEKVHNETL